MINIGFLNMEIFSIIFLIMFCTIFFFFGFTFFNIIKQYRKDEKSPRLTVQAKVVSKRNHYRKHSNSMHSTSSYYVTFEVESGDRMELRVPGSEFGYLVEGDTGLLTFQGTRFLEFNRNF